MWIVVEDTVTFYVRSHCSTKIPIKSQTSTTVDKNLANNIVIFQHWSRITGLRWLNVVAFDPTTLLAQRLIKPTLLILGAIDIRISS